MKRFLPLFFLVFFIFPCALEARVYLDVNAPTLVQIPIVLPKWKPVDKTPPSLPAKGYEILESDLTLSGFFRVINFNSLPAHLQKKEGIPSTLYLQEWVPAGEPGVHPTASRHLTFGFPIGDDL